jgi:hypothetical protein
VVHDWLAAPHVLSPERREPPEGRCMERERASVLALGLPEQLSQRVRRPLCLLKAVTIHAGVRIAGAGAINKEAPPAGVPSSSWEPGAHLRVFG